MDLNSNVNEDYLLNSARTDETSFSYSNRSNASLQILKADFIAFTFFLKEKDLKSSALNISRNYDSLDHKSFDNHLNENDDLKNLENYTPKFDPKEVKKFLFDNFNLYYSKVNQYSFNKHSYMEFFRNSNIFDKVGSNFNMLFSEFESYVIKLFSVHPTLGSTDRGIFIDDDGSMIHTLLDYIRSYESSMYLLSQKQHYYFYVSLFLLIVLLRNFRRFLHHYKSSSTLSDLMLMMAEAISMCQKHLYKTFIFNKDKFYKGYPNKYTNLLLNDQNYTDDEEGEDPVKTNLKLLKTHNKNCLKIKEDIFRLCRDEFKNPQSNTYVDNSVMELDTTYGSDDEFFDQDTEFTNFYDNISSFLTTKNGYLDTSLDYDKSEIAHLSDFNLILDDKICWWISELCSLCNLYCRLGHSPAFISKPNTKLVLDGYTSVLPKLSNACFTNLDVHRSLLVRKSIYPVNKKTNELRSEAKAQGYIQQSKYKSSKVNSSLSSKKVSLSVSVSMSDDDIENMDNTKLFYSEDGKESSKYKVDKTNRLDDLDTENNLLNNNQNNLNNKDNRYNRDDNQDNKVNKENKLNKDEYKDKEKEKENNQNKGKKDNKENNKENKENKVDKVDKSQKYDKESPKYKIDKKDKLDNLDKDTKYDNKTNKQDKDTTVPKPKVKRNEYNKWTDDETNLFLEAINLHGIGNWSYISRMFFQGKRSQTQLKDKWVNLQRYKRVKQVQPPQKKVEDLVRWVLVTSEASD